MITLFRGALYQSLIGDANGRAVTFNGEYCLQPTATFSLNQLEELDIEDCCCQQDGATSHITCQNCELL